MSNIQKRCDILKQEIAETKSEILGEFVCNDEEDNLDQLIDLAIMLGEAYVYRDNVVSKVAQPENIEDEWVCSEDCCEECCTGQCNIGMGS